MDKIEVVNEHIKDGQEYKEMEYPHYRKIGDTNLYKLMADGIFLNVLYKDGTHMIAKSRMNPAAAVNFLQQSSSSNKQEFDGYYSHVQKQLINE